MKPGTKPTPTAIRTLTSLPRSDRPFNQNEPTPSGNLDAPPEWLSDGQKASWRYAIEHAPHGLLKFLDRSVLTVWVVAEDCHRQAVEAVIKHGMLVKAPNTGLPIQSPYMAIQNRQAQIMLKAAAEMGFTPSSRTQIQVERQPSNAFASNGAKRVA